MTTETGKSTGKAKQKQTVTRMAGLMSLGTLISRILGFVRDRLVIQYFDVNVADAFYAAFRLPNFFRILLGEGALSVSFLPAYVDLKEKEGGEQQLAGTVWSFLLILGSLFSVLGILYMPSLLDLIVDVDKISQIPGKYQNTLFFAQLMFAYLFLVSQFAFFTSMLQSHDEFFIPGLAPAIFNLAFILNIIAFNSYDFFGVRGDVMAVGIILGGIAQFLVVFIKSYKISIIPSPNFIFTSPRFLEVLRRTGPSLIGIGAVQFLGVLNVGFASSLQEGSITYLYLADRLLELPQSVLAISLGAALLPRLTSHWAKKDTSSFLNQIYETTSMYYFLAIPSAIGIFILSEPLVTLLFSTKNMSQEGIYLTASLVQVYGVMLLISGTSKLLLPGFYAVKNTFYPALASCIVIVVHYFLAPQLMSVFGLKGLVISTVSASLISLILTLFCFQLFVAKLSLLRFFKPILSLGLLNLTTVFTTIAVLFFWKVQNSLILKNLVLMGGVSSVVGIYFGLSLVFKIKYAKNFINIFRKKVKV